MPNWLAFDTETHLIKPGMVAPKLVCGSFYDGIEARLLDAKDTLALVREQLQNGNLVAHNAPYDLGVIAAEDPTLLPLIFRAYDENRIACTQTTEKILDVEAGSRFSGKYSLESLSQAYLGIQLDKTDDSWRTRYSLLDGVPIPEWPERASKYALQDAQSTYEIFTRQRAKLRDRPAVWLQYRADFALHLASVWGMRTDPDSVSSLYGKLSARFADLTEKCVEQGWVKPDGVKDTKAIKAAVLELNPDAARTPAGAVQINKDSLQVAGEETFKDLLKRAKIEKLISTYVPVLELGTHTPINTRYNVVVDTYRTSSSNPNIQNLPRSGGVRECYVPRNGYVYVSCDYDTLELRHLAQACLDLLGESEMARVLNEGRDLHTEMASLLLGCSYEETVSRLKQGDPEAELARQCSKMINFGVPGGLGVVRLVDYARSQFGLIITPERAKELKALYLQKWPEMVDYFAYCSRLCTVKKITKKGKEMKCAERIEFPRSDMARGWVDYCAVCNGFFQSPAAMGAKDALYAVSKECYGDETALSGSRPVVFLHDEIVMETPEDKVHEAAARLQSLMISAMQPWAPAIPITATPVATRRWYKGAKPVLIDNRLVPSKPVLADKDRVIWIADL